MPISKPLTDTSPHACLACHCCSTWHAWCLRQLASTISDGRHLPRTNRLGDAQAVSDGNLQYVPIASVAGLMGPLSPRGTNRLRKGASAQAMQLVPMPNYVHTAQDIEAKRYDGQIVLTKNDTTIAYPASWGSRVSRDMQAIG